MTILLYFAPMFVLQTGFQLFFVTTGKPNLGLLITILSGITNMVLDYFFIVVLNFGISGAAYATGIGYCVVKIFGLIYFSRKRSELYFVKFKIHLGVLKNTLTNSASEMITNFANSVTTFLYNFVFLKYYGEIGAAAITILLYFDFVFTAIKI